MKKIFIIAFVFTISVNNICAQQWESYFQFGVGTGYLMDATIKDSPLLQFEYGKTFKWIDLAASVEYANSATYTNQYLSFLLKSKFDFVSMFTENSRHSLKLGVGVGIGTTNLYNWHDIPDNIQTTYPSANYTLLSVLASYEHQIADNTSFGVFFNNYPEHLFFGLHYVGLSLRRNF